MGNTDLLLITHRKALEVDGVIDAIRSQGLSVERINLCQYPEDASYTWTPMQVSVSPLIMRAKVGWFHDPGRYTICRSLEGHGRELALRECDGFWEGLALATEATWVNPPASLILSSRKLYQLAVAKQLGIAVPETLISNDLVEVDQFFTRHQGAVTKSLANGYSVYGEEQLKLYSRYYPQLPASVAEGLSYSPMVFQRRIEKRRELRVTCVDGECFGLVADTSDLIGENVDIRRLDYQSEKDRFMGIEVPLPIVDASRKLVDHFNLSYAGLDWIEDVTGAWFFLELNCMGAFKWSELCGAGDITCALANAIVRRVNGYVANC